MNINNCINLIKLSLKHKKNGFILNYNSKNVNVIKAFLKINIIKFVKIEKNKLIVYLNYFKNSPIFRNIINMYKPSNKKYVNLKFITDVSKKNNWIFLISSSSGIINNFEAMKLKKGGLLIAKIWN